VVAALFSEWCRSRSLGLPIFSILVIANGVMRALACVGIRCSISARRLPLHSFAVQTLD
jgi:hypothetical protein